MSFREEIERLFAEYRASLRHLKSQDGTSPGKADGNRHTENGPPAVRLRRARVPRRREAAIEPVGDRLKNRGQRRKP